MRATLKNALNPRPLERFSRAVELADRLRELVPSRPKPVELSRVVATLHGIRTHASWQRAFAEVASQAGLQCRLDRWNFGYFSVFQFLLPWSRRGRVTWFRQTYHDEFGDRTGSPLSAERPSIIAHSFGTYVLGYALLRYPYLRFNKVLLCGSILPTSFPWGTLVDRGQVQAVRNEYGSRDVWTQLVQWFVPGTGPSGLNGFESDHPRVFQERFDFSHSEYFEKGHMEGKWVQFIRSRMSFITPQDQSIDPPPAARPWALLVLYAVLAAAAVLAVWSLST